MKKKLVFRALMLFFCTTTFGIFFRGDGWAAELPYLYVRHTTTAYITGGKTDYKPTAKGMKATTFRYLYLEVDPEVKEVQKGMLTLAPSGAATVNYYKSTKYVGQSQFSKAKEFTLAHHHDNNFYCLVDGKDNHAEFYKGAETAFSGTSFSISLGETKTTGTFPRIRTAQKQLADKCVPYVEWTAEGSSVTGLKWRFVDPSVSTKALVKQKSSQPTKILKIFVRTDDGKYFHNEAIDQVFTDGIVMEGNLTFSSPIEEKRINFVRVDFEYEDAYAENAQMVYAWQFFTK
ncbi:MAG: hypothetical protein LBJ36_07590 [Synergistaceae bacterium]|jgi:hypothetical protein|nr:hypothetical protein [Synergistaceae bacterium]